MLEGARADPLTAADDVLDDDRLADEGLKRLGELAGNHVISTARRERHDDLNRLVGEIARFRHGLRPAAGALGAEAAAAGDAAGDAPAWQLETPPVHRAVTAGELSRGGLRGRRGRTGCRGRRAGGRGYEKCNRAERAERTSQIHVFLSM